MVGVSFNVKFIDKLDLLIKFLGKKTANWWTRGIVPLYSAIFRFGSKVNCLDPEIWFKSLSGPDQRILHNSAPGGRSSFKIMNPVSLSL